MKRHWIPGTQYTRYARGVGPQARYDNPKVILFPFILDSVPNTLAALSLRRGIGYKGQALKYGMTTFNPKQSNDSVIRFC